MYCCNKEKEYVYLYLVAAGDDVGDCLQRHADDGRSATNEDAV
jgi:hypothetical protein